MNKRSIETRRYDILSDAGKWLGTFVVTHDGMLSVRSEYGSYSYWWHSIEQNDFRVFLLGCDDDYLLRKLSPGEEYDGEATEKNVREWIRNAFQAGTISAAHALEFEGDASRADFTSEFGMHRWLFDTRMPDAHERVIRRTDPRAVLFTKRVWPKFCEDLREELAREAEFKKTLPDQIIATIQVVGDSPSGVADEVRTFADRIEREGVFEFGETFSALAYVRAYPRQGGEAPIDAGRFWGVGNGEGFPGEEIAFFANRDMAERFAEGKPMFEEDEGPSPDLVIVRADLMGTIWNSYGSRSAWIRQGWTMSEPICGHNRDALQWALESDDSEIVIPGSANRTNVALIDVRDPIKLAAIIGALLHERGFVDLSETEYAPANEARVRAFGEEIVICRRPEGHHKRGGPLLNMSEARKFALRVLDSPNATCLDILGMIKDLYDA